MNLEGRFADRMDALLDGNVPERIGVAVSGGSDSTALMHLAAGWAASRGVSVFAVTVDHGLRTESAAEAAKVRAQAEALGVAHATIRWSGWDGQGNLQDAARRARRRLLWFWSRGLDHILLGHTMEDQAETVLRNLARGSGVAGLSGMAERVLLPVPDRPEAAPDFAGHVPPATSERTAGTDHRPHLLRPLLDMRRQDLRDWLSARGITWSDDPSNDDPRFDRVRARRALAEGAALGLTVEGLAETARRQRRARNALERRARDAALEITQVQHGDVIFDPARLAEFDDETRLHLVAHALRWVSSSEHRPRMSALEGALEGAIAGRAATLHGCVIRPCGEGLRVCREWNAVVPLTIEIDGSTRWDRRWRIDAPGLRGCTIRAAGEDGVLQAKGLEAMRADKGGDARRDASDDRVPLPPHACLVSAPAVFRGDRLVSLPPWRGAQCRLELNPPMGGFADSLLSR